MPSQPKKQCTETASLELALKNFTSKVEDSFTLEQVMQHLEKTIDAKKNYHLILKLLQQDPWIFWEIKKEMGIPQHLYFHNATFRMVPRLEEIQKEILIPGHRFLPFCSQEVLPCDCKLFWQDHEISTKILQYQSKDLIAFHSLMGLAGMLLYIDKQNSPGKQKKKLEKMNFISLIDDLMSQSEKIALKVYDFSEFYKKNNFQLGDSILVTVLDWKKGIYKIAYSPLSEIENHPKECKLWLKQMEDALEKVVEEKNMGANVHSQLAKAFFFAGKEIFHFTGYHIGGLLEKSKKIELNDITPYGLLTHKSKKAAKIPNLLELLIAENENINQELEEILDYIQSPMVESIIEKFMLDEFFHGTKSFERVLQRCFSTVSSSCFKDREQEKKFYDLLKEMWQKTEKSYNPAIDKHTGKCRSRALLLYEESFSWARSTTKDNFTRSLLEKIDDLVCDIHDLVLRYKLEDYLDKQQEGEQMKEIEKQEKLLQMLKTEVLEFISKKETKKKTSKKNTKDSSSSIYQLKISLMDTKPPVWRSIQVKSNTTLEQLHYIIQDSMGWEDYHLHAFEINHENYGPEEENSEKISLDQIIQKEKQKFRYTYDFGDSWEHQILVEKILPAEKGKKYPVCVAGQNACPPEDCGGIPGYYNILEIMEDPDNEEYEEMLEWLGGEFNPSAFDLKEVNKNLKR